MRTLFLLFVLCLFSLNAISQPVYYPKGKECAVTFSIDDGFWKSTEKYLKLFDQYQIKATFNLTTDWIAPESGPINDAYNQQVSHGTWPLWKTVLAKGHEIGSHSVSHPHLPELTEVEIQKELLGSKKVLQDKLGIQGDMTFAFPFNHTGDQVESYVAFHYSAARAGGGNINIPGSIRFHRIQSWWPTSKTPAAEIISRINEAKQKKGWLVIGLHGLDGEGYEPLRHALFEEVLQYLNSHPEIYVDTFLAVAARLKK